MPLHIEYGDSPGLTVYAFLFSSSDKSQAFNPSTNAFETFSLASQSSFVIQLSESPSRVGFYSYIVTNTSNIPESKDDQWYLTEVFQKIGSSYSRAADRLVGATAFYWDGTKEVALSDRNTSPTAQQIWEYSSRTLTQELECPEIPPCPDYSSQITDIQNNIEEIKDLLAAPPSKKLPTTQTPKLSGAKPPVKQSSSIRFL